jgi:hypothetical protein
MSAGTNAECPLCYGRGGARVPTGTGTRWAKCPRCFPLRDAINEAEIARVAREDALRRYVTGNQNVLAYNACRRLGYTPQQLAAAVAPHPQEELF